MEKRKVLVVLMVLTALIGFNLVGRGFTGLAVADVAEGDDVVKSYSMLLIWGTVMLGATIFVLSHYLKKTKEEKEEKS